MFMSEGQNPLVQWGACEAKLSGFLGKREKRGVKDVVFCSGRFGWVMVRICMSLCHNMIVVKMGARRRGKLLVCVSVNLHACFSRYKTVTILGERHGS